MTMRNPALFQRLFGTPLMILPSKLDAIIAGLGPRFGLESLPEPAAYVTAPGEPKTPGYRVAHGVGVVDVFGVLQHRGGMQADSSYVLGYDRIAQRITAAIEDPAVKAVLLQMDSPGGEVAGVFALAQQIRALQASSGKPVRAAVSDLSASAAYLLASATSDIAISETGMAGSIGVVMRHVDLSAALAKDGVQVEHVYSGAHKVDGNPYQPLAGPVRETWQAEVDALRRQFADTVGAYRGARLTGEQAWATEADVYRGQAAIDAGLADRLVTADEVLAEMRSMYSKRVQPRASATRGKPMDETNSEQTISAAAHTAAVDAARKAGANDERTRIVGILSHAEAEGRTAQALALAKAGLTIEQAAEVLAATPKVEPKASAPSAFEQHMAAIGNPKVGAATGDEPNEAELIDKSWARAFGRSGHA